MLRTITRVMFASVGVSMILVAGMSVIGNWIPARQLVFTMSNRDRDALGSISVVDAARRLNVPIVFSFHTSFALSSNGMLATLEDGLNLSVSTLEGSNRQILFSAAEYELDFLVAAWSPDGTALAFVKGASSRGSDEQIYLWHQNTVRNLTPDHSFRSIFHLEWSVDGTQIAFLGYSDFNSPGQIYTLEVNDGSVTAISPIGMTVDKPSWSPDGSFITFGGQFANLSDIYVVELHSAEMRNLTNNPSSEGFPAWSPDGTQIAFDANYGDGFNIYVMDVDGNNVRQLTDDPRTESLPMWSPDGQYIAFRGHRPQDGALELRIMRADGSEQRLISYETTFWVDGAVWLP
jgi:Tol biopolymer transport system component